MVMFLRDTLVVNVLVPTSRDPGSIPGRNEPATASGAAGWSKAIPRIAMAPAPGSTPGDRVSHGVQHALHTVRDLAGVHATHLVLKHSSITQSEPLGNAEVGCATKANPECTPLGKARVNFFKKP